VNATLCLTNLSVNCERGTMGHLHATRLQPVEELTFALCLLKKLVCFQVAICVVKKYTWVRDIFHSGQIY
jgi:hypothetical protein